jgi:hypothetical protein
MIDHLLNAVVRRTRQRADKNFNSIQFQFIH